MQILNNKIIFTILLSLALSISNTATKLENPTIENLEISKQNILDYEESTPSISSSEQSLLDAGYGTVVLLPTGDYGILMQGPDHTINGKRGNEILYDYISALGLEGSISGGWMMDEYYTYFAENLHEIITPTDDSFWD